MAYEIICDTCGRSLDESYFLKVPMMILYPNTTIYYPQTASLKDHIMHTVMKTNL